MPSLPGFVGGSYERPSHIVAGERTINCFPEPVPQGGKARGALVPVPGTPTFATLTDAPGRGIFAHDGRLWAVFGRTLYEIDSAGTPTSRGTLAIDGSPATFATNGDGGNELMVTSGGSGYILDLATHVLTTPLASGSSQCGQIDGFFISLNNATSTFRISDSLDGSTWSGVQVAQRTSESDPWTAMIVVGGELVLIGNKTGNVWYNAGLPTFPFAERPEGAFQRGIAANASLARFLDSVAWLGIDEHGQLGVYVLDGYTPRKISKPGLEYLIQQFNDDVGVADAVGWTYAREGHEFYVLTFPLAGRTFAYDALTQQWHERLYWDQAAADYTNYRPIFHATCFGHNLVCDSAGNRIYRFSSTVYTDVGGTALRRARRCPHLANEHKKMYYPLVELECERGVGNAVAPGDDPLVALRYSNNGGRTWGASRTRQIGAKGEYDQRVRWEMCGHGRDRVFEVWQSDPVSSMWFDLLVTAQPGVH